MEEHRPAARADEPLYRHAPTMRPELIAALPVARAIGGAAAVKLRAAFAEAEHGTVAERERDGAGVLVDPQVLHLRAAVGPDAERERIGVHVDDEIARAPSPGGPSGRDSQPRRRPRTIDERSVVLGRARGGASARRDGDANRVRGDRSDRNLDRRAGDDDRRLLRIGASDARRRRGAREADLFQQVAAREARRAGHRATGRCRR